MKSRNLIPLLLLLLAGAGVAYWMFSGEGSQTEPGIVNEQQEAEEAKAKHGIVSPFDDVEVPMEELVVEDPAKETTFVLSSGTKITIPANVLVNESGEVITESVTLGFTEYREAAEIIASGIPMSVRQEDGSKEWMQTAGMFQVRAINAKHPINIAEGKAFQVSFVSAVEGEYDFWSYDEEDQNWINEQAAVAGEPVSQAEAVAELKQLKQSVGAPPVAPELEEGNILGFTDLDVSHIPALKGKSPLMLVYVGNDPAKAPMNNQWINKATWFKKKIHATKTSGVYELTLLGDSLYSIKVRQALVGADLEMAKEQYAAKLAQYEAKLAAVKEKEAEVELVRNFRRTMRIQRFGLYNYDILWKQEDAVPLMADFDFDDLPEEAKKATIIYLVTGEGRVVVQLPSYDWGKLRVDLNADNKMLAVLPNNKVALFPQSAFNKEKEEIIESSGQEYLFDMEVKEADVNTLKELSNVLAQAG